LTGNEYSFNRKRTFFNLYAFTDQDSSQTTDQGKERVLKIRLTNVEVRNFLHDHDSLIEFENDNILLRDGDPYLYGNTKADAQITVEGSVFRDSSFCLGLINS